MTDRDDAVPTESPRSDPSRNATTHGLTARRPLSEQEDERFRVLVDHWTSKHRPETLGEEALVQAAAVEYVRFLRCVQADELQKEPNARKALEEWRDKRRHAIRRKAQDLRDDPERIAAELHESAFGIDWLLGHWRRLLGQIDAGIGWSGDDLTTAMHLMGRPPRRPAESDVDGLRLWETVWQASPSALDVKAQRGIIDAEAAAELRALVAERIARLELMRPIAWEEVEGPQVAAVESSAMLDTSKEGQLRNRYRREAFGDMLRGLGMLNRLKVERSKIDDRLARQERLERQERRGAMSRGPEVGAWREMQQRSAAARPVAPDPSPPTGSTAGLDPDADLEHRNGPPAAPGDAAEDRRKPESSNDLNRGASSAHRADPRRTGTLPRGAPAAHRRPRARPGPFVRGRRDGPGRRPEGRFPPLTA